MKKLPYNITEKYINSKYNPEGISKEEGFNCLSMAVNFCKEELGLDYKFDVNIIDEIDWDNVSRLFHENPDVVFKQVEKHFLNYYEYIAPHEMKKGDIISVDTGNGIKIPCVFVGNNKILMATDKRIKVADLKGMSIFDAYRIKESHKITTKAVYKMGENPEDLELIDEESYLYNGDISKCYGLDTAAWIAIVSAVISLASAAYAYANTPEDQNSSYEGLMVNTRSTKEPLKVVYGERKVGGNDVYYASISDYHKDLYIIQTLSEGEIESVEEVFIDDQPLSYYAHYTGQKADYEFYNGSSSQTYDATINSIDPLFTDNMRYTAYIRWHFLWNRDLFPTGEPQRFVTIKGKKVLDFRDDTTAWSDNAVLCTHDFFTNSRYGLGVDAGYIDVTSWTTVANYMDTKGWNFNYITNGNNNPWTTLQDMIKHFRGSLSWFDGKYYLLFADLNEESSVMTIEDKHIVQDGSGKAQIKIIQPSRFDKPNGLKCNYFDKDKSYTKDEVLVGEAEGVIQNINLFGYTDRATVGKLANYKLERLRLNRIISGTFRDDCLELAPHDLVTFNSSALSIADRAMRIVSTSYPGNGLINLSLQYESLDLYDDDYDAEIEGVYTCSLPKADVVVSITNPQISEDTFYYRLRTESRLHITFTIADTEPWFKHVEIWQAIVDVGDPAPVEADYEHQYNTTNDFNIDHVEQGVVYYIALISVSIYGVKDSFANAPKLSHTIDGNSSAPESLAFLSAIPSTMGLTLFSDKLDDPDIESYEFRLGPQWNGALFISAKRSPQEAFPGIKPGTHTFFCNTKGTNGIYGITPRSAIAVIQLPIGWTLSDTFTCDYDGIGTHDNTEHTTYSSEDYLKCSHSGGVLDGIYTSPEYDTGVAADDYYMYLEADIVIIGAGTLWNDAIPSPNTWNSINISTRSWNEIFSVDEAPKVNISILYKVLSGGGWSEMKNAEILSSVVNARYFQVKIEIEDPSNEINALVEHFTLRLYTET